VKNTKRAEEVAQLLTQGLCPKDVSRELGIANSTVHWYINQAKRGSGPKRDGFKNAHDGFQRWAERKREEKKADQARYAQYRALYTPGQDAPVCRVCGGRAPTWDGHAQCTGRGRQGQTKAWRRAVA